MRAVEHLRQVAGELQLADVRTQVALSLFTNFVDMRELKPADHHLQTLHRMLDQLVAWSTALKSVRE